MINFSAAPPQGKLSITQYLFKSIDFLCNAGQDKSSRSFPLQKMSILNRGLLPRFEATLPPGVPFGFRSLDGKNNATCSAIYSAKATDTEMETRWNLMDPIIVDGVRQAPLVSVGKQIGFPFLCS